MVRGGYLATFIDSCKTYDYVQNNPVNLIDPYGLRTYGGGLDLTGALLGGGGSINFQVVKDTNGDIGIAVTYGKGGYTDVAGASIQLTGGTTNANSINDLAGESGTVGGGLSYPLTPGPGIVVTGEVVIEGIAGSHLNY